MVVAVSLQGRFDELIYFQPDFFFFLSRDQLAYTCVLIVLQCIIVTSCVIGLEGPVKTKLCVVVLVACRGNRQ